ncbi:hypothetical protein PsYK624_152740 [Phanerochaete sordida]|uniref:Uncharacterized protein n=1 Tax=Phanerochaete sordida TaxID=48140 RepID=A0A9P3GPY9_9APHY|nr:hypothetical protein PsYK624_152740 [Phanerochaete sordida]
MLRSLDDVKAFCTIVETSIPVSDLCSIAGLVEHITAMTDGHGSPWLHLVFLDLLPKLHPNVSLTVELLPTGRRPWRTLHPALPRPLAGSLMPMESLVMHDMRFPSGRSIARLLSSMPRLVKLFAQNISFDIDPTPDDFLLLPYGLRLHSVVADDVALPIAMLPRLLRNTTSHGPTDSPGRIAKYHLSASELGIICELLNLFGTTPSQQIEMTRDYRAAEHSASRDVPTLNCVFFNKRDKDPSDRTGFQSTAPPIMIALADAPADEDSRRAKDVVDPPDRSTPLQVQVIAVHLGEAPHRAFELCGGELWARFAAIALKFSGLRHVQLVSQSHRHETQLGTLNSAFRSLIQAGKLKFMAADAEITAYGFGMDDFEPRLPGSELRYEVDDLPEEVRGVFTNKIVLRMIQKMGTRDAFSDPGLAQIQHMLDELPEYRYHWQLWQDREICARLVRDRLQEWQLGFGATALQGLKILANHVKATLLSKGLDKDAAKLVLSDKIQEILGDANDVDRPFWWYQLVAGQGKLFGSALIHYTFSNHVRPLGGYIPGIWVPPEGALILSVLAAERALQAYSTGVFIEPRIFSASNWMDGWHYVEQEYFGTSRYITRIPHLQKAIRAMPFDHWNIFVSGASTMRKQIDEMRPGEAPRELGKDEGLPLGIPWDEPAPAVLS